MGLPRALSRRRARAARRRTTVAAATTAVTAAVVGAGAVGATRLVRRAARRGGHGDPERWRAVTVNLPLESVREVPAPLADLGDAVEVRLQPAPADKGTEIHARLTGRGREHLRGTRPLEALRSALRQSKQVLEVGEVLQAHRPPTTRRTLLSRPLEGLTDHAGGEGRL
jgi:hypothetical protein